VSRGRGILPQGWDPRRREAPAPASPESVVLDTDGAIYLEAAAVSRTSEGPGYAVELTGQTDRYGPAALLILTSPANLAMLLGVLMQAARGDERITDEVRRVLAEAGG